MDNKDPVLPMTVDIGAERRIASDQQANSAGRMQVARLVETRPYAAEELRLLLRKRLRFVGVLMSFVELYYVTPNTYMWVSHPDVVRPWLPLILSTYFQWAVTLLVTALLCSRLPLSIPRLRVGEIILFGALAAQQAFTLIWMFVGSGVYAEELANPKSTIAGVIVIIWFALVVGYGVLIPNTGRRCARVVVVLSTLPVVVFFLSAAAIPGAWEQHRGHIVGHTFYLALWMGVGAALAIYGAQRIESLRREAAAARQLGQYRLRQRLGSGGMGDVFLAEHVMLRRPCAVKLIRPERAGDPKNLLRFEREVQATAALTHPNTVQIFDYGQADDGSFYYAMEYLPGLTLEELVKQHGPLPATRVVYLLRQVCAALQEAHAAGLIHRDIKPSNVIACDRGGLHDVAKLLDFGLVCERIRDSEQSGLTQEGTVAGTPAYLSPEQAAGGEGLNGRSDLYGMGALAYFLLTGQPPFVGRSAVKVLAAHLYEAPRSPDSSPPGRAC